MSYAHVMSAMHHDMRVIEAYIDIARTPEDEMRRRRRRRRVQTDC